MKRLRFHVEATFHYVGLCCIVRTATGSRESPKPVNSKEGHAARGMKRNPKRCRRASASRRTLALVLALALARTA